MKAVIRFRDGRTVDLDGDIDSATYAALEATQGRGARHEPLLFCGGCDGGIFIKHGIVHRDVLFGAHFEDTGCQVKFAARRPVMLEHHRRMQQYTVNAAEREGIPADMEVRTSARTVVDVVIDERIGVEVQRSGLSAGAAVGRTGRSMAAGLETVAWVAETPRAEWAGRVPGFEWLDSARILAGVPEPGTVRSRGVASFTPIRTGLRSQWRPVLEPRTILVDDAVVRIASGEIRPVIYAGNVELIDETGLRVYEEITGVRLPPFTGEAPLRTLSKSARAACERPRVITRSPARPARQCQVPGCENDGVLYPAGWLCTELHRPGLTGGA